MCGDEMGPLGGEPGSDSLMLVGDGERAIAVSVGVEPEGVPAGVIALGGGPARFLDLLRDQVARRTELAKRDQRDPADDDGRPGEAGRRDPLVQDDRGQHGRDHDARLAHGRDRQARTPASTRAARGHSRATSPRRRSRSDGVHAARSARPPRILPITIV